MGQLQGAKSKNTHTLSGLQVLTLSGPLARGQHGSPLTGSHMTLTFPYLTPPEQTCSSFEPAVGVGG